MLFGKFCNDTIKSSIIDVLAYTTYLDKYHCYMVGIL